MSEAVTYRLRKGRAYQYLIGDNGFIFRFCKSKGMEIPRSYFNNSGYVCTSVTISGKREKMLHRIVYEAHLGAIPKGYEIHHADQDKTNNKLNNLKIATRSENNKWRSSGRGATHHASLFSQKDIDKIILMRKSGLSNEKIAKSFKCCRKTIDRIVFRRAYFKETRRYRL